MDGDQQRNAEARVGNTGRACFDPWLNLPIAKHC
jgi:hypothetical protein